MNNAANDNPLVALLLWSLFNLLIFLITSYYAKIKGYLSLPFKNYTGGSARVQDVILIIILFILTYLLIGPLISSLFLTNASYETKLSIIPIISFTLTILAFLAYAKFQPLFPFKRIIKDVEFPANQSLPLDMLSGIKALVLSIFPLFATLSFLEAIFVWLNIELSSQQSAIQFFILLKDNLATLLPAIFTIVLGAPIIEEFVFRGVIQSHLRKRFGSISTIFVTSILFSLFHYSTSQGIQNVAIIISLFVLSLYLGFAYEKTRSLISSITLHVTFNLINVIKIFFYTS